MSARAGSELLFLRMMKTLVRTGLPLPQGLRQWGAPLAPARERADLLGLSDALDRGLPLGQALEESRFPVSPLTRRALDHLEASPDPAGLLEALEAGHLESTRINEHIRESLIYPAAILLSCAGVLILLTFTFFDAAREFATIWGDRGSKPLLFALYSAGHPLRYLVWALLPAAAYGIWWLWTHPLKLSLPIVREMVLASHRARFCQVLRLEIAAGRPLNEVLGAAADLFDARHGADLVLAAGQAAAGSPIRVHPGGILSTTLQYVLNNSGTGEAAEEVLSKMQSHYAEELRRRGANLRLTVETWVVAALGVLVGFLAVQVVQTLYGYLIGTAIR